MRHREEKLKVQRSVPTHIDAYPYKERHFSKATSELCCFRPEWRRVHIYIVSLSGSWENLLHTSKVKVGTM